MSQFRPRAASPWASLPKWAASPLRTVARPQIQACQCDPSSRPPLQRREGSTLSKIKQFRETFKSFLAEHKNRIPGPPKGAQIKKMDQRKAKLERVAQYKEMVAQRYPTMDSAARMKKQWETTLRMATAPTKMGPTLAQMNSVTLVCEDDGSAPRFKGDIVRAYRKGLTPWRMREKVGCKYVHLCKRLGKDGMIHVHLDAFRVAFVNKPDDSAPILNFAQPDPKKKIYEAARGVVAIHRKDKGLMIIPMIFVPSAHSIEQFRFLPPHLPDGSPVIDGSDLTNSAYMLKNYAPYKFHYGRRGRKSIYLFCGLEKWLSEIGLHEQFSTDLIALLQWKRHSESVTWMRQFVRYLSS